MQTQPVPKIIIVEDSLIESLNIQKNLKSAGMQVIGVASSSKQLFSLLKQEVPSLILMDINLGAAESGIDLARLVAKEYQIPIVFTTSYCDDSTIANALEVSPYGYLVFFHVSLTSRSEIIQNHLIKSQTFKNTIQKGTP